jgi:hypothetical protein
MKRIISPDPALSNAERSRAGTREPDRNIGPSAEREVLLALGGILERLSPQGLGSVMALANDNLPNQDPRKIRVSEVRSLRRLASQAHALGSSMVGHAQHRRKSGDGPAHVSPEVANTVRWTDRLILALEGVVRPQG